VQCGARPRGMACGHSFSESICFLPSIVLLDVSTSAAASTVKRKSSPYEQASMTIDHPPSTVSLANYTGTSASTVSLANYTGGLARTILMAECTRVQHKDLDSAVSHLSDRSSVATV
jgi:hypothetical protein